MIKNRYNIISAKYKRPGVTDIKIKIVGEQLRKIEDCLEVALMDYLFLLYNIFLLYNKKILYNRKR